MRLVGLACAAALGCFAAAVAFADGADDVTGTWVTDDGGAHVKIFEENGKYCGKIVWLQDPLYPKEDKEAGKPLRDRNNPDPSRRNQPYFGMYLLRDFVYKSDNAWTDGTIYNPENGKIYDARLRLDGKDKLNVRGFIGISLIGGSTVWKRVDPQAEAPSATASIPEAAPTPPAPAPAAKDAPPAK